MDKKDKKILYELFKNARISFSQLAKRTRMPQETVRYRVNNLKKDTIEKFIAVINGPAIGLSYYQLLLKLQNANETKKQQLTTFLTKHKNISWVAHLEGNYSIGIIIAATNHLELKEFMRQLDEYNQLIMKKTLSINLEADFFPPDHLLNKKREFCETKYLSVQKTTSIDQLDKKILTYLAKDARIHSTTLAKLLNVSTDTIIKRIKKLEKNVIKGYTIIANQQSLSQQHYKLLLYLNSHQDPKEMLSFIKTNPNIIATIKVLAEWDYEIDIEVQNTAELRNFTMELTEKYANLIRDYESIQIISMPKYNFYP